MNKFVLKNKKLFLVKIKFLKAYNCLVFNFVSSTISINTVIQEILCHGVMAKLVFLLKKAKYSNYLPDTLKHAYTIV